MPLNRLKPSPDNWHYFVNGELDLLRTLVNNVEKNINEDIIKHESKLEEHEFTHSDGESEFIQIITTRDGLDDMSWDLEEVFKEYFPSLQRKAFVISLFSFLEDTLKELCIRYQVEDISTVKHSDLKGKGIERYKLYLTKVAGLDFQEVNTSWNKITKIRDLRNVLVHNEGAILAEKRALLQYAEAHEYLSLNNNKVKVLEGFLMSMLIDFEIFISELSNAISSSFGGNQT